MLLHLVEFQSFPLLNSILESKYSTLAMYAPYMFYARSFAASQVVVVYYYT